MNSEHEYIEDQCSDRMKIQIKIQNLIQKLFQPKANHCKAELVKPFSQLLTHGGTHGAKSRADPTRSWVS